MKSQGTADLSANPPALNIAANIIPHALDAIPSVGVDGARIHTKTGFCQQPLRARNPAVTYFSYVGGCKTRALRPVAACTRRSAPPHLSQFPPHYPAPHLTPPPILPPPGACHFLPHPIPLTSPSPPPHFSPRAPSFSNCPTPHRPLVKLFTIGDTFSPSRVFFARLKAGAPYENGLEEETKYGAKFLTYVSAFRG